MRAWPATLAAAAALAGCGGGAEPRATKPAKPPSGTFDVQGHGMFIECTSAGEPAVILDSGLGVNSTSTWAAVRPKVAELTRVCIYDRAGMAASEPGPKPRTIETMTGELHELLGEAGVEPPYVLAGASLGGMNAQLFAVRHPDEVVGVVLIDSLHPDLDREIEPLLGKRGARERRQALAQNAEGVSYGDLLASDDELRRASGDFPPLPLIALKHGISFGPGGEPVPSIERLWGRLQEANAKLSPTGRVVVAERSHHRIAEDQPELVVDAIREVVEAARAGG
ncbi:MAG TPA: alpha/beta hydrolase [Solirubrobacteraceae bacterium]|nr:alpha/beta hydrolase [Solirubrobacteraceae bacterium]